MALAPKQVNLEVVFEPDGGGWHVAVPSIPGCHTWGRSVSEARRHIREALACCSDVYADPEQIARDAVFDEDILLPAAARVAVKRYQKARAKAETEVANLRAAQNDVTRALTKQLSLRDAGELLGLSHQGVRKILKAG